MLFYLVGDVDTDVGSDVGLIVHPARKLSPKCWHGGRDGETSEVVLVGFALASDVSISSVNSGNASSS